VIETVLVNEGEAVRKGQVLATLDESDASARLASAKADRNATQATLADADYEYQKALLGFWTAKAEYEKSIGLDK